MEQVEVISTLYFFYLFFFRINSMSEAINLEIPKCPAVTPGIASL